MAQICKIISLELLTQDVLKRIVEKPENLHFNPGQAVDVSINKPNWKDKIRAFTFTSLPTDNFVEFIIKTYPQHNGVTNELLFLSVGDELIIGDVFGDISYKGNGVFIAGGAGITPFLSILKHLQQQNKIANNILLFANKTKADIILEPFFKNLLKENFVNILSDEKLDNYEHGFINETILKKYTASNNMFYLCGPPPMMQAVEGFLIKLNINPENIIKESF